MEKEELIDLLEERGDLIKIKKSLHSRLTDVDLKLAELDKKLSTLVEDKYIGKWFKSPDGILYYVLESFPNYPTVVRCFSLYTGCNTKDKSCFTCVYHEEDIVNLETKYERKIFDNDTKRIFTRFGQMIEETWDGETRHNIRINALKIQ